jgi:hypothetical protein
VRLVVDTAFDRECMHARHGPGSLCAAAAIERT